jgi:hypothetical protein
MLEGTYKVIINNFNKREAVDNGFVVEIEHGGTIHTFQYDKSVKNKENVIVATFNYSKEEGLKFISSLPSTQVSKELWGLQTQKFQQVSTIMLSPNHWDEETTGNKHWFFIVNDCKNDRPARGFFNEFLDERLREHRKVFELLGTKMKAEPSEHQLSGLGFSSTQRNHLFCRVTGSFARTVKVLF